MDVYRQAGELVARARAARLGLSLQNRAAEIRIWSAYAAGMELTRLKLRGGDRRSDSANRRPALRDYGVTKYESCDWQRMARWPEPIVREAILRLVGIGREVTVPAVLRYITRTAGRQRSPKMRPAGAAGAGLTALEQLAASGQKFRCILVTPLWQYLRAPSLAHDGRVTKRILTELPIAHIAAEDALVHLLSPPEHVRDAIRVIERWGYRYLTISSWVGSSKLGGQRTAGHSMLIHGTTNHRPAASGPHWSIRSHARGNSAQDIAEIASAIAGRCHGPFLHLFGQGPSHGWTVVAADGRVLDPSPGEKNR